MKEKYFQLFSKKVLTNPNIYDIILAVIQRQQVPVKAQAFLPRREIELQKCDEVFLFGVVCASEKKDFFIRSIHIGR